MRIHRHIGAARIRCSSQYEDISGMRRMGAGGYRQQRPAWNRSINAGFAASDFAGQAKLTPVPGPGPAHSIFGASNV